MKKVLNAKSVYDKLLFLIVFLMPFSDKLNLIDLGFIHIFAYRIAILCILLFLLVKRDIKLTYFIQAKYLSVFILFLILFASFSLLFVESKELAFKQLFYLFSGALSFVVFYTLLKKAEKPLLVFSKAWFFSFVIIAFFGILEILTNAHFISGYTNHLASYDFIRPSFNAPLVSYTNPNDFSIYLGVSIVVFMYNYLENKSAISVISMLVAYFLLYNTLSRFGLISVYLVLICLFFLASYRNNWIWLKSNYKSMLAFSLATVFILFYIVYSNPIGKPIEKDGKVEIVQVPLTMQGLEFLFSTSSIPQDSTGSTAVRKNLIINGLSFAWLSKGLGIGAGQFEYKMKNNQGKLFTNNISNPHNFVIEIFSQYGIIGLFLLIAFFVVILSKMFMIFKRKKRLAITNEFILLSTLIIVYVFTSNSASSYIPHTLNWVILTLIIFVFNEVKTVQISNNV